MAAAVTPVWLPQVLQEMAYAGLPLDSTFLLSQGDPYSVFKVAPSEPDLLRPSVPLSTFLSIPADM